MTELGEFAGRWHPVLVHVPIGALLVAGVLELLARTTRWRAVRPAVAPIVIAGAAAAIAAAATGLLLGASGGYAGPTFAWHQRVGVAVALGSVVSAAAYAIRGRTPRPLLAPTLLFLTLPAVVVAGHLGGTLTHGEGYLTERLPSWLRGAPPPERPARVPADVKVYAEIVAPVLEARCGTCHGAESPRGELRLDSADGLRKGGHSGPAFVAGRAASSEIVRRVWLPASHKDAMPPGGRHPLTPAEASILRWWIDQGASFDATLADVELDPQLRPSVEAMVGRLQPGAPAILAVKVPPADPAALAAARRMGVSVTPLAVGTSLVAVHCTNVARIFGDAELARLAALAPQVTWLSLSGTQVTDAGLGVLAGFSNLTRLHLDRTRVSDAGLARVSGLKRLEYLNLYGSAVTDSGLSQLSGLTSLREIYVWRTAVTPAGAERLRSVLPRLRVDLGEPEARPVPSLSSAVVR